MSITIQEYFAAEGSQFSNADAEKIGPVLQELAATEGALTERAVIEAAHSTNNPLHEYFEWNDERAANLYRVEQAQRIIKFIKVKYIDDEQPKEARAFQIITKRDERSARTPGRTSPVFKSVVLLSEQMKNAAAMMDAAIADAKEWRTRYQPYMPAWLDFANAFQPLMNQLAEFEEFCLSVSAPIDMQRALTEMHRFRSEFLPHINVWAQFREHAGYLDDAIKDAEAALTKVPRHHIAQAPQAPQAPQHRKCLSCGKEFVSKWIGNRMCYACSGKSDADA